jgi:DNA invertase Pin-like site-specific DNA recombinase
MALMGDARLGAFDVAVVWPFDRRALGIDFVSHRKALETSAPMGKAMLTIIAAMSQLFIERRVIRERVVAGLEVRTSARRAIGQGHWPTQGGLSP